MSTPKHTQGPWRTFTSPNGLATDATLYGSNGEVIGHIGDIHSPQVTQESIARDEANARLIAAAPELLETLKRIATEDSLSRLACTYIAQVALDKATKGEAEPEPNEQEANYDLHASDGLD